MLQKILHLGIPLALLATSAGASTIDIVANGGFTTGDFTDWTTHTCSRGCTSAGFSVGAFPDDPGALPPDTTFAAETKCAHAPCNGPGVGDWIAQTLATDPLQTYTLSFFYDPGVAAGGEVTVLWNGAVLAGGKITAAPASTWQEYTFAGLTSSSALTVLEFTGRNDPGEMFLTDISVTFPVPTPEPESMLLIGGGLLAIGAILRSRRNRSS